MFLLVHKLLLSVIPVSASFLTLPNSELVMVFQISNLLLFEQSRVELNVGIV